MGLSFWHMVILLLVIVLLFGRGKISDVMGDVAKGIKSFKKGMAEDDEPKPMPMPRTIDNETNPDRSKVG
jgi:sec-independent protein translocase protein TatA